MTTRAGEIERTCPECDHVMTLVQRGTVLNAARLSALGLHADYPAVVTAVPMKAQSN
jgi:hypothetical protein